jgi:uncharacterized membrane protein
LAPFLCNIRERTHPKEEEMLPAVTTVAIGERSSAKSKQQQQQQRQQQYVARGYITTSFIMYPAYAILQTLTAKIVSRYYPTVTSTTVWTVWTAVLVALAVGGLLSVAIIVATNAAPTPVSPQTRDIAYLIAWIPALTLFQEALDVTFTYVSTDPGEQLMWTGIGTVILVIVCTAIACIVYNACGNRFWNETERALYGIAPQSDDTILDS